MGKNNYYLVTNPKGKTRIVLAETKFHAIAKTCEFDNGSYEYSQYKCKKTKL